MKQNIDELFHHGIKGQKWGIRKYQNEDGTFTEEGKERYYKEQQEDDHEEPQKKIVYVNKNKSNLGSTLAKGAAIVGGFLLAKHFINKTLNKVEDVTDDASESVDGIIKKVKAAFEDLKGDVSVNGYKDRFADAIDAEFVTIDKKAVSNNLKLLHEERSKISISIDKLENDECVKNGKDFINNLSNIFHTITLSPTNGYNASELFHHGIKGQKWGIRKYQNEDGTLTDAGKARYRQNGETLNSTNATDEELRIATNRLNAEKNYELIAGTRTKTIAKNKDVYAKALVSLVGSSLLTLGTAYGALQYKDKIKGYGPDEEKLYDEFGKLTDKGKRATKAGLLFAGGAGVAAAIASLAKDFGGNASPARKVGAFETIK